MKVSVIIPVYNEEKVIEKCLESLSKQKLKDFEIIVVDDGSRDNSKVIIQNAKSQFKIKNLTLLKQKHGGPAIARNLGAKHARGDILVFVDADMTFDKVFLKKLIAPILNGKAKGTFSKEEYASNWNNVWARCWNYNQGLKGKRRIPDNYPDTQKVFRAIRKSDFLKVGGFDRGGYTDDYSLADKLGFVAVYAKGARYYHNNPDNLKEVFIQSKWTAKRKYKLGIIGVFYALIRVSLPIGVLIGLFKAVRYKTLAFFLFKIVFNTAATFGIIEYNFFGKGLK